jgi:hypothetical protein
LSEKDSPGNTEQVIREILKYLIEHPDAKDTPEGIGKWWRSKGGSGWRQEELQQALDSLVTKGWLIVRELSPSQKAYGLNKKWIKEISECLASS